LISISLINFDDNFVMVGEKRRAGTTMLGLASCALWKIDFVHVGLRTAAVRGYSSYGITAVGAGLRRHHKHFLKYIGIRRENFLVSKSCGHNSICSLQFSKGGLHLYISMEIFGISEIFPLNTDNFTARAPKNWH